MKDMCICCSYSPKLEIKQDSSRLSIYIPAPVYALSRPTRASSTSDQKPPSSCSLLQSIHQDQMVIRRKKIIHPEPKKKDEDKETSPERIETKTKRVKVKKKPPKPLRFIRSRIPIIIIAQNVKRSWQSREKLEKRTGGKKRYKEKKAARAS